MQYPCNAFGLLSKKQYAPNAEIRFMIKLLTDLWRECTICAVFFSMSLMVSIMYLLLSIILIIMARRRYLNWLIGYRDNNSSCLILSANLMLGSNSSISYIVLGNYHSNTSCNNKDTNREEKPKEPLCIVTEIAAIIFLVAFTDFFPFISKHGIDLTDMYLHL